MLFIRGRQIDNIDDPTMVRAFGRSYERNEQLGDWIEKSITRQIEFRYNSIRLMRQDYFRMIDHRNEHLFLAEQFLHERHNQIREIVIRMTGRRHDDEAEANAAMRLRATPYGYTWHHAENIEWREDGLYCHMYLVNTNYHRSHPHAGGVNEYNAIMREPYH